MNQSANTRGGTSRARHQRITRTAHRTACPRVTAGGGGLEASGLISMAATVIFWTADLRVTASTRIGALPPSSWQIPAPSCWRTRTAGRGAYAIDHRNGNARYLQPA